VRGHRLEALFTVALGLGLRQGEILGLTWDAVDLRGGILQVRTNLQRVNGVFALRRPKSMQSRRTIVLPALLIQALQEHQDRQETERRAAADPAWNAWRLVFCTAPGQPYDGPNVTRYAQRLLVQAGLPRLTFHELRHSCASLLAAQGVPDHEIARLLGHTDARLTMNVYVHGYDEGRQRMARAIDAVLDATAPSGDVTA
jgi:integrase